MSKTSTIGRIPENLADRPTDQFLSGLHDQVFQVLALLKGGMLTIAEQTDSHDLLLDAAFNQLNCLHNEIDLHMGTLSRQTTGVS